MAAWPNGPDLSNWLNQPVTSSREGMYEDLVAAAFNDAVKAGADRDRIGTTGRRIARRGEAHAGRR